MEKVKCSWFILDREDSWVEGKNHMGVVFETTPFVFEFIKSLSISSPKKEKFCWLKRDAKRNLTSSSFYSRVCCLLSRRPPISGWFFFKFKKQVSLHDDTHMKPCRRFSRILFFLFWKFVKNVLLVNRLPLDLVWQIPIIATHASTIRNRADKINIDSEVKLQLSTRDGVTAVLHGPSSANFVFSNRESKLLSTERANIDTWWLKENKYLEIPF